MKEMVEYIHTFIEGLTFFFERVYGCDMYSKKSVLDIISVGKKLRDNKFFLPHLPVPGLHYLLHFAPKFSSIRPYFYAAVRVNRLRMRRRALRAAKMAKAVVVIVAVALVGLAACRDTFEEWRKQVT